MILDDKLYEKMKDNKDTCTIYDDNYVILVKGMPCYDAKLDDYLNNMKRLKESGVDIATVVEYRLIPETISLVPSGSYTKGVFIEERAKGIGNRPCKEILSNDESDESLSLAIDKYVESIEEYVSLLESKNSLPQEAFNKFVTDYISFPKFGLCPDSEAGNFFFEVGKGFSFIDPLPTIHSVINSNFPEGIIAAVFGYGIDYLHAGDCYLSFIPSELNERFKNVSSSLLTKIGVALRKANTEEKIIVWAMKWQNKNYGNYKVMDREAALSYLKGQIVLKDEYFTKQESSSIHFN